MSALYYVNYTWRVLATGFSFVFFCSGALILGYIIAPVITLLSSNPQQKAHRAQYWIHLSFRIFVLTLQTLGLADFRFKGIEHLQQDQGCLFISNHPTLIDYVVIVSQLRRCDIIVKTSLFDNFFIKRIIRAANYIPNSLSLETFEQIKQALEAGGNVLIFPEGTRSTPNQPLSLQRGAANVAVRAPAPIRLIHIKSSQSGLSKGDSWYKVPKQKLKFGLCVGELVDSQVFLQKNMVPSRAARALTRYLKTQLEQGLD